MEQTLGKSPVLQESVMVSFTEQKMDHESPHFSGEQSPCELEYVSNFAETIR